jgi:DNA-directed RNA polymerase subunit beta'
MQTWYATITVTACLEAETRIIDTTVGRVLFNRILPPEVQFTNEKLDKGGVKDLIADVYEIMRTRSNHRVADAIKPWASNLPCAPAPRWPWRYFHSARTKTEILDEAQKQVEVVERDFRRGLLTEQEQNERIDPDLAANHHRCCQGR